MCSHLPTVLPSSVTTQPPLTDGAKALFAAIQALEIAGKSASIPTIAAQLSRDSGSDALIPALMNIIQNHGFGAEFALTEHISLVKGYALRRRLYGILDDARDQLMAPENEAACPSLR